MVTSEDSTEISVGFKVIKNQFNRHWRNDGDPSRKNTLLTERSGMRMASDRNYVYVIGGFSPSRESFLAEVCCA
ncbi:unnamed protein product [Brugia timori]|uniref:Peptidase M12A domain-containing protein n=1 Tax=Brugia timori TaxID=42155 RepID=A0A0R3Q7E2_9BILA|nr:unnamed protein product [Brugia timori]